MRKLLSILLLSITVSGFGQVATPQDLDSIFVLPDTAQAFRLSNLYTVVLRNHPVAKQASLLSEQAKQEIRLAKGAFDPKLTTSIDLKNFQDKEYFNMLNSTLKIPVWFPIDPMISVDRNRGVFLNPENSIPSANQNLQFNAGVSLPIGKGLFIDDRRATVKQAVLFQDILEAEQIKMVNKILLEATKDYWNWYHLYYAKTFWGRETIENYLINIGVT